MQQKENTFNQNQKSAQKRKNFISVNEEFKCLNCGELNLKADKTCRNHCKKCLFSLHVDKEIPGDRLSLCRKLMAPFAIDKSGKKGFVIFHKCLKCGKIAKNRKAEDDSIDTIIKVSTGQP